MGSTLISDEPSLLLVNFRGYQEGHGADAKRGVVHINSISKNRHALRAQFEIREKGITPWGGRGDAYGETSARDWRKVHLISLRKAVGR
jgi:hypothetical protein